jgi:hypothetical protein
MQRSSLRVDTLSVAGPRTRSISTPTSWTGDQRSGRRAARARRGIARHARVDGPLLRRYRFAIFCKIAICPSTIRRGPRLDLRSQPRRDRRGCRLGKQFVDLGAGDCAKAAVWLPFAADELRRRRHRRRRAESALPQLASRHPQIDVRGALTDFTRDSTSRPMAMSDDVFLSRLLDR